VREKSASERRLLFGLFSLFSLSGFLLNETNQLSQVNQINKTNQINQTDRAHSPWQGTINRNLNDRGLLLREIVF
jgi:hypothetical protein